MTKDELINKLRYVPGDVRILIFCNSNIEKGFHEIEDRIKFSIDEMTPDRCPTILLTIS